GTQSGTPGRRISSTPTPSASSRHSCQPQEEVVGHEKPSREEEFIVDGRGALEDFLETAST
ncbi:unnamed protein product, partial [Scytosiphon promiscuus]